MSREDALTRVANQYENLRAANHLKWLENTELACERCPGLREMLDSRRETILSGIRSLLKPGETPRDSGDAVSDCNRRISAALKAAGLPDSILEPVYTCPVCKDTGYVYDPSRRMCECMEKALSREMLAELTFLDPLHTFENFDESRFPETPVRGGTQPQQIKMYRKIAMAFADSFPDNPVPNLVFSGKSGLGKTFLMECIAHRLAERGHLPEYTTAFRLMEIARRSYLENNPALMSPFLTSPILMVDDLGTEPLLNNITVTQLFNLVNEREKARLSTVFSTNLSMDELQERYTERVTSRFSNPSAYRVLFFEGIDIRTVKR